MDAPQQLSDALADRYEIEREIGAGGMANVYLARDVRHHRRVALKVLKPELGAVLGPERFLAEIRVTANLQHPNLLPLFDSGEAGGLLYYVMPFVDGESLRARLDREKQLPVDEAVRIATAIAGALDYAHRHGVIHRDLKPENVLLQEGQPLVTDFGIALAVSNAGGGRITQTGLSLGTPQYMSPEQATGDRTIDGRTDIYSLGTMLYEMLAGDPPYHASTSQAIIAKVITENVPDVRLARPSVPENVAEAIHGALEKLPADRWTSAAQFSDALHGKALVRRRATPSAMGSHNRLNRARSDWALLGTFALGLMVAGGAWQVTRRSPPNPGTVRFEIKMPPTAMIGSSTGPSLALTPDGQTVIYVGWGPSPVSHLFRRRLSDLSPELIPGTDSANLPAVSPDGRWIAFLGAKSLKRIPADGGVASLVADTRPDGISWARNGVLVLGSTATYPGLQRVSARGGNLTPFTHPDSPHGELDERWPVVLDDGETVLFTSWRGDNSNARIGVASLKDGKTHVLDLPGTYPFGYVDGQLIFASREETIIAIPVDLRKFEVTGDPLILASGVEVAGKGPAKAALGNSGTMVFQAASGGSRLQITDSAGHVETAIDALDAFSFWDWPRFSPDGKKVVVAIQSERFSDLWIYDLQNKTRLRLTNTDSVSADNPSWSPDGKHVVYRSTNRLNPTHPTALMSLASDGSEAPHVIQALDPRTETSIVGGISPDGRYVLYRTIKPKTSVLQYRMLVGDTTSRVIATARNPADLGFSADGHWLAYSSNESGANEVYITRFPEGGSRWAISTGGGSTPVWAATGTAIYYVQARQVIRAQLKLTPGVSVIARQVVIEHTGPPTPFGREYDVSPDGRHFLSSAPLDTTRHVMAVLNWKNLLKNKPANSASN